VPILVKIDQEMRVLADGHTDRTSCPCLDTC